MKKVFALFFLFVLSSYAFAQDFPGMTGAHICSRNKQNKTSHMDPALLSPNSPRHSYDVLNYKLNLDLYSCFKSASKTFNGTEILTFKVDSTLNSIQLNAVYSSLGIDSVRLNGGAALAYTHNSSTNILTITLDRTYNVNETVNLYIKYHHNNVSDGSFNVTGGYVFTDCEPEGAREWFPCWDRPSDKATFDITAKVSAGTKLGSNGRLADSVVSADSLWYRWISRDPLSTYLAVLTGKASGYNVDIVWWHKLSNPNDSIPIRLYYATGENIAPTKNAIADMTTYYSQVFGEHPFEKNGFASVSSYGGGMENQTLTTISPSWSSVNYLISHEYGHQWFGDMITCGTWADIWLNEGFATYCEALYFEHTSGYSAYKSSIVSDASSYMSGNPGWPIYNPSWAITTPPVGTLFNGPITYDKGACVLHMLRYTIGDSLFFAGLKAYATDTVNFKMKCAVTDDFTSKMSSVAGQDLTWFIDEWVKQPNHPAYQNTYGITNLGGGNWRVNFKAYQTLSNTTFHKMPIVLKVSFTTGSDSLIRVMNDVNNQTYAFNFNRQPTAVVFDPNNDIVIKSATLTVDVNSHENGVPKEYSLEQNFPNPFNPVTTIRFGLPKNSFVTLKVFDAAGREVSVLVNEMRAAGVYAENWKASNYTSGVYFYTIKAGDFSETKKMLLVK